MIDYISLLGKLVTKVDASSGSLDTVEVAAVKRDAAKTAASIATILIERVLIPLRNVWILLQPQFRLRIHVGRHALGIACVATEGST